MEQFIRYLYEYRQGQPYRNVGFVRVEQGDGQTTVHIHGKGLQLGRDAELLLYLYYMEGDIPVGILQGAITNINPAVNYRLTFTDEDTGERERYAQIQGIILESQGKRRFASSWSDMPVNVNEMRIWEKEAPAGEAPGAEDMAPAGEDTDTEEEALDGENSRIDRPAPAAEEDTEPGEEVDNYIVPSGIRYKKITRRDLAMLPRCEWHLANNSFLLHGYYNYHHLILIEDGEELWLGVPGIYHRREARAAEAFGFSKFTEACDVQVELGADEQEDTDSFGYWRRRVRRGNVRL